MQRIRSNCKTRVNITETNPRVIGYSVFPTASLSAYTDTHVSLIFHAAYSDTQEAFRRDVISGFEVREDELRLVFSLLFAKIGWRVTEETYSE